MKKRLKADWPPESPSIDELEAIGSVLRVMFGTLRFGPHPGFVMVGPHPLDDSIIETSLPRMLPPLLTPDAHAEAIERGVPLRPNVLVLDASEILGVLDLAADPNGGRLLHMSRLTLEMIRAAFAVMANPPPVLLDLEQAAHLIHVAPGTLKRFVNQGRISRSVKPGKPLVFFRDLLVLEWMPPS